VPLGSQADFIALTAIERAEVLTWADGEHTIYNHANERNARVSDWFLERLGATAA
jgi:hypothetical protein